ncbi:hypothetical protein R1flu_008363 [Riccia fluitans]|uniref:Ubiquitin-like protease family profile domain-containing protein n=1 Tax=Riccia fluitans TaxID=41844 RepID=A0ABD1YBG7_9MARC
MNAKVALMERKDLYNLLEAKMEGFQIANHPGMIGGFENLNLTITKKWMEIPTLNLEEFEKCPTDYPDFVRGHRTFQDEVDRTGIDVCYQSLLKALKAAARTLPNSLVVFEYMRSIFDSYVNPTNDPNVQPLVKGLDVDDFSVEKFFGLQDPTTLDDAQASPDFEEDLRTNERASELVARYDKTNHVEEPMIKITRLRKSICPEFHDKDMQGNLPAWIFVPIHGKNHWSLAIIRLHNDVAMLVHLDSFRGTHYPEAIFHIFKTLLCLIVPIDPALIMTGIMNVEQQQDGHSCGKHVLQMLAGAAKKESHGLDRCFREEGLIRYIATLDQVRSFDVVFGMYLSGKMAGPSM